MSNTNNTKYLFVTGGVISGLGKGVTTSSLGLILKSAGYNVSAIKVDMYLNLDAGTMNPIEHGEVFVTDDGMETDQDVGNYERFLSRSLTKINYMTMGQIYAELIRKERALEFEGKTVQGHIHVPNEIINRIVGAANNDKAEIIMVEVGGTVGEYQNVMFFEAIRRMKQKFPRDVFLAHLVYLITPGHLGEMKSKPAQASIYELYRLGLTPDIVICRSDQPMDDKRKDTLSFNTGVPKEHIFAAPTISNIYKIPILFSQQGIDKELLRIMDLKQRKNDIKVWDQFIKSTETTRDDIKIAICGKYFKSGSFSLNDAYLCVIEAIKHAAWKLNVRPTIEGFDVERFDTEPDVIKRELSHFDAIIVPQGWGKRGVESKIKAVEFARTNKIPYLGLCFGMQMAVIEYARNILQLNKANTTEADPTTQYPVIYIMPEQEKYLQEKNYGGTIRLGAWPCKLKENSIIKSLYEKYAKDELKQGIIYERHRHRYEVNSAYKDQLTQAGLIISGSSPDGNLAEAVELDKKVHPFFVATQYHPEYKSWPLKPHPLFLGLIEAALKNHTKI